MKRRLLILFSVLLLGSCVGLAAWLGVFYDSSAKEKAGFAALRQKVFAPENSSLETSGGPDILALRSANRDCVGWLTIPGTDIDYPVMQSPKDPEYYLRRSFQKEETRSGTPFLDARCSPPDSGQLIIYGHDMADGSMFSPLLQYEDSQFFEDHPTVQFYTLDGRRDYAVLWVLRVKGAYTKNEWSLFRSVELSSKTEWEETIRELSDRSLFSAPELPSRAEGQLLTLVTCEYSQENGRLAVVTYCPDKIE